VRAIGFGEYGGPETLRHMTFPRPSPEPGEVLVRVVSAGVNPLDCRIRAGLLSDRLDCRLPMVPGWDVAGVVDELGVGGARFRKGDRVFAFAGKPVVQWGCYAEFVAVPAGSLARMPAKLLFEEAAAVPVAALAAYQALFGEPGLGAGRTVLVLGAGGGVGHFAVQLARNAGARVAGVAGSAKQPFVLAMGAEIGIDYSKEDFVVAVRRNFPAGVDVVLDLVGGETLARSCDLLAEGGRLVSLVEPPDRARVAARGATGRMLFVEPDGERLEALGRLFDERRLKTHVQKIYPLSKAAEAHRAIEDGHTQGKLVLNL
jgi:NADPH2:quinone reductase